MITNDKMIEDVKRIFDTNLYESRLWVALLSRGISTAGELSEISAVPRSRTYDVLESLEKKGLITVKRETRPVKYIAVAPEDSLEQVKKNHFAKLEEQKNFMDGLKKHEMVLKLKGIHKTGSQLVEDHEKAGLLRSRRGISHHIDSILRNAKANLDIIATPSELKYLVDHHIENMKLANDKGVDIRVLGPFTDDEKEALKAVGKHATIKKTDKVDARIILRDGEEMIFSLFPHEEVHHLYDNAVWVHSPYFVKAMSQMFENVWSKK